MIIKLIIIIIIIFILLLFGGISYFKLKNYDCDIGKNETTGDYNVKPDTFFNNRRCAIEDCSAFNKYQKEIGGKKFCLI